MECAGKGDIVDVVARFLGARSEKSIVLTRGTTESINLVAQSWGRANLREGDEIVLDGGFQLMLSVSGSIQKGGHYHADGTFHDGEH